MFLEVEVTVYLATDLRPTPALVLARTLLSDCWCWHKSDEGLIGNCWIMSYDINTRWWETGTGTWDINDLHTFIMHYPDTL